MIIGTFVGLIAGYVGGWTDTLISRVIDVVIAFPFLVLVIAIVAMLGPGLINLYIAVSLVSWVLYARIVRGETLALKRRSTSWRRTVWASATAASCSATSCRTRWRPPWCSA